MSRDALVVGINNYQNLSHLNAPAEDAESIARVLENYGDFDVKRLPEAIDRDTRKPFVSKERQLNFQDLENALVKLFLPESKQAPTTALFYYSGHGIRKDKGVQEGFLCTSDVNPDIGFRGISLKWLREILEASPIQQQIIWLDCCHSGELVNFNRYNPGEQGQARDRCFIAASRAFEFSFEDLNSEYSVLTKVLLAGLDPNRSAQQSVTSDDLIIYIKKNLRNKNQRPVFSNFGSSPIKLTSVDGQIHIKTGNSKDTCPYKGLEYFDFNDEDPWYFYGREKLTDKLLDRVRQSNFLAILGASGSGKSSVVRAGLLHQLKLGQRIADSATWKIKVMLPGHHPLQNLGLSWLDNNLPDVERATQLDQIESLLNQGSEGLRKLVQTETAKRVVLVIDQFEEVFSLCKNISEREFFFKSLLEITKQSNKICIIITLRSDFLGNCFKREYSGLYQTIQDNLITVSPMNQKELKEAILKPAQKVNLKIEQELIDKILKDIEGSNAQLILLQYTLTELWKQQKDNQLKLISYVKLGGVGETLNRRATEVYNSFNAQQKESVKYIFLNLTQLGEEGTEDTRKRIYKQDLITSKHTEELVNNLIKRLADEKLIVTSEYCNTKSETDRKVLVEVVHEALIRNWKILQYWLDINRNNFFLLKQREIEATAKNWRTEGYKNDYLLRGKLLKEARSFNKNYADKYPLSKSAIKYIFKSIKYKISNYIKFLIFLILIPLIGTSVTVLIIIKYKLKLVQINNQKHFIQQCEIQKKCPGRLDALENLVKSNISLKSYNLSNINLQDAEFPDARLAKANLQNTNLKDANLVGSNLKGVDLSNANLNDAFLINADLSNANFDNLSTIKTYFKGAILVNVRNLTFTQIKLSCSWEEAIFKGNWDFEEKRWMVNKIENSNYIKKIKEDKYSDPPKIVNCPQ